MFKLGFVLFLVSLPAFASGTLVFMRETEGQKQIYVARADGSAAEALTSGDLWHLYPEIDGSGRWVTYVEGTAEALQIVVHDMSSGGHKPITEGKGNRLHPDFSGDGRYLAFSETLPDRPEPKIVLVDREKDSKETLGAEGSFYFPSVSSDGAFLIYQRNRQAKEIVFFDRAEKKERVLSEGFPQSMSPALSFDDRLVAFTAFRENNWDIYVMPVLGGQTPRRVTDAASRDFAPAFRPDGSLIFASDRSGHFELYEISAKALADGSLEVKELVKDSADLYAPAVSGEASYRQSLTASIPLPGRSSFGTIRVGDKVYVVGGHQGKEHTYPPESFLDRLDIHDLKSGLWKEAAPRPRPCHGFGLAAHGKYIYAFGGFAYSEEYKPKWKSLDFIDRYDTETDKWEELPARLPKPRSSNVVAKVGTKVYLIGGWDSTPQSEGDLNGRFHYTIDVFDLETESTTTSPFYLPDPLRRALSGVVVGNEVVLVGGLGQGASHFELLDNVTVLNPETGWSYEMPKLPFATFAPAVGLLGDSLFVFGGMYKTGPMDYSYVSHIYELEKKAKAWLHTGRYLHESKGFAMVVPTNDGELSILGGHTYEGDEDHPVSTVERFAR